MKRQTIALGALAAGGLALAWWLGSPLFLNRTVEEAFPMTARAVVPDSMTREQAERMMARAAESETVMIEAMPSVTTSPVAIKAGQFRDTDRLHRGSGTATIYRLDSGRHLLRLENFNVTNGPDLRVLLSPLPNPMGRDDLHAEPYIELASLKGNIGNQNYEIPDDVDIASQQSVIIYCKPFRVVFSVAPLGSEVR